MRWLAALLMVIGVVAISTASPVLAYDAFPEIKCEGKVGKSTVCNTPAGDPIAGPDGILLKAVDIVAYIAGAFAIIMILVASIRFITSGSDLSTNSRTDTDVEQAKSTIASALVGLAVIVLAKTIIKFVIEKL